MASSWILFFSYQNDARSDTHQIMNILLLRSFIYIAYLQSKSN